jgi:hypothetical protein
VLVEKSSWYNTAENDGAMEKTKNPTTAIAQKPAFLILKNIKIPRRNGLEE